MATTWVGAAVKRVLTPWAVSVDAAEFDAAGADASAPRVRGSRTPDGVASWLSFHGVEIKRTDVTASGVWRSS